MIHLIPGQHIHLIGIGGAGMSAIARILLQQGYYVTGSDRSTGEMIDMLKKEGAHIYHGHDATYVNDAEIVVATSAVPDNHIEILSAQAQAIPVYRRLDFIGKLTKGYQCIAVSGTHGKTTTTAMIAYILLQTGRDPSYIVGGVMGNTHTNAAVGDSNLFVIEADEYDNMFHGLRPQIEVITSVEYDHPDFFRTPNQMMDSFSHFVGLLPADGLLVACADEPGALVFARNREIMNLPVATYGIHQTAAYWQARNIEYTVEHTMFDVFYKDHLQGRVTLRIPGVHNILNALAALIVTTGALDVKFSAAAAALETFVSAGRRFELVADEQGIAIINDYAHHPTAIRATIEAARLRYPQRQVWAVWQPHTYSRTLALMDQFATAFDKAHHAIITEIYAAREKPIEGLSSRDFLDMMEHPDVRYVPMLDDVVETLLEDVESPAVILVMSAGDATRISHETWQALKERERR
ncbi:UDP-N-acetylmuramate--L-alanine ligase [bacterium]|nr:UDP-N-acetylmuramate--L-alanine ligase [bacterium]